MNINFQNNEWVKSVMNKAWQSVGEQENQGIDEDLLSIACSLRNILLKRLYAARELLDNQKRHEEKP